MREAELSGLFVSRVPSAIRVRRNTKREVIQTDENQQQILSELAQFTGTTRYYRSTFGTLNLTEGVHYFREKLGAYWLIDVIETHQPFLTKAPFQLWGIYKRPDSSAAVVEAREDTGLEAIARQEIRYTDFPLDEYELFCIDRTVLLKSEY